MKNLTWITALGLLLCSISKLLARDDPPYEVTIPRLEADVQVDGFLDEAAWAQGAVFKDFFQYLPVDGRAAQDSTEVVVWYAPTAIYFGIRAYATSGAVRATLADRDKIEGDDYIQILLDTFNDSRQAVMIGVNPLGVQSDGILRDGSQQNSIFASRDTDGAYIIDFSPDFVYESKGRLTEYGYEVEIEVPFKSLQYQATDVQNWGFNVIRKVQHSGHENTWTPVRLAHASFLAQQGTLIGLNDLRRGLVLDVTPVVTSRVDGGPVGTDGWRYEAADPAFGTNVRWGVTNNLTFNATANPDFSQIEADVAQVQYDPRDVLFFPEKRPFFLDGIELFQMPNQIIYSRRVADPVGAVKLTGKVSGTNIALLSAVDAQTTSLTGHDYRYFNALRIRRDLGGQSTLGAAYTDKIDGQAYNRVASVDGRLVFADLYSLTFQGAASIDRRNDIQRTAPLWDLRLNRAGRAFGFSYTMRGIHGQFRADTGFIRRAGIVRANFTPRYTLYGQPGAALESWTGSVSLDGVWDYDRFTAGKEPNDARLHLNGNFRLRGGWQAAGSVLIESFKYPPALYADYAVQRIVNHVVVDTVAFTGTDRLFNLDGVVSLQTPRFQNFSGNLFVLYGQDTSFFEWASSNIFIVTLDADWRPSEQLRVNLLYTHQQYMRQDDWSSVGLRRIPRLKVEYQLTRSIFFRVVGQYDADFVDALRDDSRTNDPILIWDADQGTYVRTRRSVRNDFRVDWLFSYRPTPGTVFFLGYGSSLEEQNAFRFRRLERAADGFFVKLSYLYRV